MSYSGLPQNCPPNPHNVTAIGPLYRVLEGSTPVDFDWLSHTGREKALVPGADACDWAAVSFFTEIGHVKKLKNLKDKTHAAEVHIPEGLGTHRTRGSHVNFWCKDGNDIASCVVAIVKL